MAAGRDPLNRRAGWAAPVLLAAATLAVYASALPGGFVFDDEPSLVRNATIRQLWPLGPALNPPPGGLAVSGRPLVNLSFALNYAWSGAGAWSYHLLSVAIHLLAGLVLFGIVRRTLRRVGLAAADLLATGLALAWLLHPLQTEAVTYLSQRSEALMGLCYLLTLWSFIRSVEARGGARVRAWRALSFLCCLAGMAAKEVMVTAPLLVLLYDRTFVSGTFRSAWARRRPYYLALALTWLPLAAWVAGGDGRGGTAGFGSGVSAGRYAATQVVAIPHYVRLALWPAPLLVDYGRQLGGTVLQLTAGAAVLGILLGATVYYLRRRPAWGFLGAGFFLLLAPSSSFLPVATETIAEHRMYLPLAAVLAALLLGSERGARRLWPGAPRGRLVAGVLVWSAAVGALGAATIRRNRDYRDNLSLFAATVATMPDNAYAQNNLGVALAQGGSGAAALEHYERAVALRPDYAEAQNNLGATLSDAGRVAEAWPHLLEAERLRPGYAEAENNLGTASFRAGRGAEALGHFEAAVRLAPDYPEAQNNLAFALNQAGRPAEAIPPAAAAVRLRPDYAEAHNNLGNALALTGRGPEAIAEYETALRLRPDLVEAHLNLAQLLEAAGQPAAAAAQVREAARLRPVAP